MNDVRKKSLPLNMESAYQTVWQKLFLDSTFLIYDYLGSPEKQQRFAHLPHLDEIAAQFPNPCGWGTGMEDSMLHAGSAIPMLGCKRRITHDQTILPLAEKVLQGMWNCTHIHNVDGFVVRSISPRNGKSYYINSSMDQFTWCVFGCWSFLSYFADSSACARATKMIADIATYCEKTVANNAERSLLRLDGKRAVVSSFSGSLMSHKSMRPAMFYAAAWAATGEDYWFERYRQEAIPGIEYALNPEPDRYWWDIEYSQMQISILLCFRLEQNPALKQKYQTAMHINAARAEKDLEQKLVDAENYHGDWTGYEADWRLRPFKMRQETLTNGSAMLDGYPYLLPEHSTEYSTPNNILRAIGNDYITLLLTPGYKLNSQLNNKIENFLRRPDFENTALGSIVELLYGYWLEKEQTQGSGKCY